MRVTVHAWTLRRARRRSTSPRASLAAAARTFARSRVTSDGSTSSAAHLAELRRTAVGPVLASTTRVDRSPISSAATPCSAHRCARRFPTLPIQSLGDDELRRVVHGNPIASRESTARAPRSSMTTASSDRDRRDARRRAASEGWCFAMPEAVGFPQLAGGAVVTVGTFDGVHLGHRDILRRVERARAARRTAGAARHVPAASARGRQPIGGADAAHARTRSSSTRSPTAGRCSSSCCRSRRRSRGTRPSSSSTELLAAALSTCASSSSATTTGSAAAARATRRSCRELGAANAASTSTSFRRRSTRRARRSRRARSERRSRTATSSARARALGRPYAFRGTVVPGDQRGRALGYPTLNIELSGRAKTSSADGVYAVRAHTARGVFGGMMNLGPRPTFGDFEPNARGAPVRRRAATGTARRCRSS